MRFHFLLVAALGSLLSAVPAAMAQSDNSGVNAWDLDEAGEYQQALPAFENACEIGNAQACAMAATYYIRGEKVAQNVLNAKPKFDTLLKLYGQTASAIVGSSALEAAKNEVLKSLRYLGGKADFDELQSSSPFINEAGVAMALFDGLVTSSFKFPMGKLFDISLTSLGERECQH